jgi:hypothetical protein
MDRPFAHQLTMGREPGKKRDALIDRRMEIIAEPLRGIVQGMIFEAVKIFKKGNFRHGFTSLVNGVATFPSPRRG